MLYSLGQTPTVTGCLTRLRDVVNRSPERLEDLIGFNRGRLGQGFYVLLLQQSLQFGDVTFFGYTYMSGGKLGLPSNDPTVENERLSAEDDLATELGAGGVDELKRRFVDTLPLRGPERLVKIVPIIDHRDDMGPADQYPASRLGIPQFRLIGKKQFFVAAQVDRTTWTLANNMRINVASKPRYDLPYSEDPRKKVLDFLASA